MLPIVIAMLAIVLVAVGVVAYVVWPHRGEKMPVVPVVGSVMRKGVDSLPTLAEPEDAYEPAAAPVRGSHRA